MIHGHERYAVNAGVEMLLTHFNSLNRVYSCFPVGGSTRRSELRGIRGLERSERSRSPGARARSTSRRERDRYELNAFLYVNKNMFEQNLTHFRLMNLWHWIFCRVVVVVVVVCLTTHQRHMGYIASVDFLQISQDYSAFF